MHAGKLCMSDNIHYKGSNQIKTCFLVLFKFKQHVYTTDDSKTDENRCKQKYILVQVMGTLFIKIHEYANEIIFI